MLKTWLSPPRFWLRLCLRRSPSLRPSPIGAALRSIPASSVTNLAPPSQMTSLHIRHAPAECTNKGRKCRNHYQLVNLRTGQGSYEGAVAIRALVLNRERRRCAPMLNASLALSRRPCSVQAAAAAQLGRSSCSGATSKVAPLGMRHGRHLWCPHYTVIQLTFKTYQKIDISTTQEKYSLTNFGKTNNWKRHYRLFCSPIIFFLLHYMRIGTKWLFSFHSFRATHFGQFWTPSASLCTSPSEWGRGDIKWGRGGDMNTSPSW